MMEEILQDILSDVIKESTNDNDCDPCDPCQTQVVSKVPSKKVSKVPTTMVEIDCSGPDIMVSQVKPECTTCSSSEPNSQGPEPSESPIRPDSRRRQRLRVVDSDASQIRQKQKSVKRKGTKKYPKSGKDVRARFKSSEDLVHRLYVCISGAADQLQTNFAGDFRSILKHVFIMNGSPSEDIEEEEDEIEERSQEETLSLISGDSDAEQEDREEGSALTTAESPGQRRGRSQEGLECGEDALMSETEQGYLSNFGYHMGQVQEDEVLGGGGEDSSSTYYQPEPTLHNIMGGESGQPPHSPVFEEQEVGRSRVVEPPPPWVPDH